MFFKKNMSINTKNINFSIFKASISNSGPVSSPRVFSLLIFCAKGQPSFSNKLILVSIS